MNTYAVTCSDQSTGLAPSLRAARLFAWGEVFILIPMHAFWMLFRSTPFVAENTASATVAAIPIMVLVLAGLAALFPRTRAALLRAEWLFHVTAAAGLFTLLVYMTVRDPFSPTLPITWPLCFWSLCLGFALLGNLTLHERIRAHAMEKPGWPPVIVGIVFAVAAWAVFAGTASGMTWAPYFWTMSLVFHAVMAAHSRRAAPAPMAPARYLESITAFVESLFAVALLLAALLRFILTCEQIGRLELKYVEFVNLAGNPMFFLGIAAALLAARFRLIYITHAVLAAIVIFTDQTTTWPIALALGYALPALYLASNHQQSLFLALALPATLFTWALGMLGFSVAGLIVEYKMGLDFAQSLLARSRIVIPVLFAVCLALAALTVWWSKRKTAPNAARIPAPPAGALAGTIAYAAAWLALLVPTLAVFATTMWPPVFFEHAAQLQVGEPSGVCHAGYSRSDEEYANLTELGVTLMRIDFHWTRIQPAPDTWDFSHFDAYLDAAGQHNVNVLALLVFDNNAVETDEVGANRRNYIAPRDVPLYLEYIRRTVTHYEDRVYAWELWNEPNMPRFWDGPMDELYELVRKSAETVRETDPDAILLGPAMTGPLGVDSAEGIELLHAIGALDPVDHPTMHLYVPEPRTYYNEFLRIQNAARKYGHPGAVWITELGDPDGGVYPWRGSREHLAIHAMKAYTIATRLGIEKLVWYCYSDSNPERLREKPKDSEHFFGLTNSDGSWKPAAWAYSLFSKNCSNTTIRQDLVELSGGLAARQLRTALYRRDNGESALVLWFEPGLRPGAHGRVTVDLGALEQPALVRSITSGDSKPLLDDVIDVTETPTFLTFAAPEPEAPVRLDVKTSSADAAWLLLALGIVVAGGYAAFRGKPDNAD